MSLMHPLAGHADGQEMIKSAVNSDHVTTKQQQCAQADSVNLQREEAGGSKMLQGEMCSLARSHGNAGSRGRTADCIAIAAQLAACLCNTAQPGMADNMFCISLKPTPQIIQQA